jgi:hypothetical protein
MSAQRLTSDAKESNESIVFLGESCSLVWEMQ